MQTLRVRVLGPFEISAGQTALAAPTMRKAQELLALILLAPQRRMVREVAAEQLWPDANPESSKKAIRQALWQIHMATDDESGAAQRLLQTANDFICVNPTRPVWLDAAAFASVSDLMHETDDLATLADAAALYRGPLLAGCYEEWCLVDRAHLEDLRISLLDRLSTGHEQRGQLKQAISWAHRLLDVEPAHERSHRRLMHLYYRSDDRTRALRQWRLCEQTLTSELGIRPSKRTAQLAAMIGADAGEDLPPLAQPGNIADEVAALQRSVEAISATLRQAAVG